MKKLAILLLLAGTLFMCRKDESSPNDELTARVVLKTPDTTYVPLMWGSSLRIVPRVLTSGQYKKKPYWFAQTFAYSKVVPANYQQDSIRERVVVADTMLITQTDTFYICRRIIK